MLFRVKGSRKKFAAGGGSFFIGSYTIKTKTVVETSLIKCICVLLNFITICPNPFKLSGVGVGKKSCALPAKRRGKLVSMLGIVRQ